MVPFGEWRPDLDNLDGQFIDVARNVIPDGSGYGPFSSFREVATTALPARAAGLFSARTTTGGWTVYGGTAAGLYRFAYAGWADLTRTTGGAYAVPSGALWSAAQFGNQIIACNPADDVQVADVDAGTAFAALGGSPPKATGVSVIKDFVVLSQLEGEPRKIHWSGLNDATQWTVGTDLSDVQEFPNGGDVVGTTTGEFGFVLQEYAVRRMIFSGDANTIFRFDLISDGKGCISPYGFATVAGSVFFVSEDGFFRIGGDGLDPIGAEKVNKWFLSAVDSPRLRLVQCVSDPFRPLIFWFFHSGAGTSSYNAFVVYNWQLSRWAHGDVAGDVFAPAATPGVTLDDITDNVDTYPVSLDDRSLQGGRPSLAMVSASNRLALASGPPMAATIQTQEAQVVPRGRARVTAVEPRIDASGVTVRVGVRENAQSSVSWTPASAVQVTGLAYMRSSGRLHRAEVSTTADAVWTHAKGVDFTASPEGGR